MQRKVRGSYLRRSLLVLLLLISFSPTSYAQESRSVETEGSVHFTGVWIDPNEPTPAPPGGGTPDLGARPPSGGTKRPGGNLPQTNMVRQGNWLLFGHLLISYVLYRWYKKQTRSTPLH